MPPLQSNNGRDVLSAGWLGRFPRERATYSAPQIKVRVQRTSVPEACGLSLNLKPKCGCASVLRRPERTVGATLGGRRVSILMIWKGHTECQHTHEYTNSDQGDKESE